MAYQSFQQEYMQMPPITRAYTTACVITTLAVVSSWRRMWMEFRMDSRVSISRSSVSLCVEMHCLISWMFKKEWDSCVVQHRKDCGENCVATPLRGLADWCRTIMHMPVSVCGCECHALSFNYQIKMNYKLSSLVTRRMGHALLQVTLKWLLTSNGHDYVKLTSRHRFDVKLTLLLRRVSAGLWREGTLSLLLSQQTCNADITISAAYRCHQYHWDWYLSTNTRYFFNWYPSHRYVSMSCVSGFAQSILQKNTADTF